MSFGGGSSTVTQKQQIPKWIEAAGKSNYELAKSIADKPLEQFEGDRAAGVTPIMQQAFDYTTGTNGNMQGSVSDAKNAFEALKGFSFSPQVVNSNSIDPAKVTAQTITPEDYARYNNPFTQDVIDKSLSDMDRSRTLALQGNADKALASKAFGGSRSAIVDAVTNSETARNAGLMASQLRSEGFDKAMGLANADVARRTGADAANQNAEMQARLANQGTAMQAALANQSTDFAAQNARADALKTAGAGLLDSATVGQQAKTQDIANLMQAGLLQQGATQAEIDAAMAKFQEAQDYGKEGLNLRMSALGMTPYSKTTTEKSSSGTDYGVLGLGLMKTFMGLSDDDEKTDIKKLGKIDGTDLNLFAYRYKDDPKTYPKVVGLMASQVEKKIPKAVRKMGGRRVIDYGMVAAASKKFGGKNGSRV